MAERVGHPTPALPIEGREPIAFGEGIPSRPPLGRGRRGAVRGARLAFDFGVGAGAPFGPGAVINSDGFCAGEGERHGERRGGDA